MRYEGLLAIAHAGHREAHFFPRSRAVPMLEVVSASNYMCLVWSSAPVMTSLFWSREVLEVGGCTLMCGVHECGRDQHR